MRDFLMKGRLSVADPKDVRLAVAESGILLRYEANSAFELKFWCFSDRLFVQVV
jgi:hypothetical protein